MYLYVIMYCVIMTMDPEPSSMESTWVNDGCGILSEMTD